GQEDEEIAALGVGIEHAEVQAHAAVGELALQAELERLGNLRVEQVADARDARRADSGLIEAAAPEALAVAAEEGEVLGRRIAQGHARLKLVPRLFAHVSGLAAQSGAFEERLRRQIGRAACRGRAYSTGVAGHAA